MFDLTYLDKQNQIIKEDENHIFEKINKVGNLFSSNDNSHIYNIYNKLLEVDDTIKHDNIECIIFIIFDLIKEKYINIENIKGISDIFIKYSKKFLELYNNNDLELLSIIFYTYLLKINKNVYNILENIG